MTSFSKPEPEAVCVQRVELGPRSYSIAIGAGILADPARHLPVSLAGRACFVVTDTHVAPLHALPFESALGAMGVRSVHRYVAQAGEGSKSLAELERLLGWLLDRGADRHAIVCALGGGVVGDLAGFAAAILMRGVDYIQIPTTLLAQVDSAVGGKTAVDMPQGKNLVGAFHQPLAVLSDTAVLKTLPDREMRAGYAEIVKYGLLGDAGFFAWLEDNCAAILEREEAALRTAIAHSCRAKAQIVGEDERESAGGRRALLNLGHTFGHAFESAAGYGTGALLHGEAVAIGMACAFDLSTRMGLCAGGECERVRAHLAAAGLPVRIGDVPAVRGQPAEKFLALMRSDKKAQAGRLTFILADGIGRARAVSDVPEESVCAVLRDSAGL